MIHGTVRNLTLVVIGCAALAACGGPNGVPQPPAGESTDPSAVDRDKEITRERLARIGRVIKSSHPLPGLYYASDTGEPGLSWRVAILGGTFGPEEYKLYKRFAFDEPWDSPNNLALLDSMPEAFRSPRGGAPPGYTYYRAFVGRGAVIPPPEPAAAVLHWLRTDRFKRKSKLSLGVPLAVPDGTFFTLYLAEGAEPVPWTKHDELVYDPDKPLPRMGGLYPDGFFALPVGGTPVFLPNDTPEATLRALITTDGGEKITDPLLLGRLDPKRQPPATR